MTNAQKRRYVDKAFAELTQLMGKLVLTTARDRQCSRQEAEAFLRYCDAEYSALYSKGIALSSFLLYGQDSMPVREILEGVM